MSEEFFYQNFKGYKPLNIKDIERTEKINDVFFSASYKKFLLRNNGGEFENDHIKNSLINCSVNEFDGSFAWTEIGKFTWDRDEIIEEWEEKNLFQKLKLLKLVSFLNPNYGIYMGVGKENSGKIYTFSIDDFMDEMEIGEAVKLITDDFQNLIEAFYKIKFNELDESIVNNNFDKLKTLIENGLDPNIESENGVYISLIDVSISSKRVDIFELLIKNGANIDKLIFNLIGNPIFLKKILDLGYNLNEINNYNKSVIECFCHDETEILELILKNTKDLKKEYLEKSLVTLDNIIKSLKYNSHYDENAIEKIFNKVNKNIELIKYYLKKINE